MQTTEINSEVVGFQLCSLEGGELIEINRAWTVRQLPELKRFVPGRANDWAHLHDINLPTIEGGRVSILIGMNVPAAHWVLEHRYGGKADSYAIRAPLGWTIMGPAFSHDQRKVRVDYINEGDYLTDRLEAMWASEFNESTLLGK
ncbi:hypothetical protein D915_010530 [Fasciola hepatica]|uniref:Uncharacterized protein n=1 Tax=Fasciola hepatica TaxID=6192 RepID=A0A4E0RVR2_FASHE|nr:hypothetical protein D915_010530 [Fasciola hepatica]